MGDLLHNRQRKHIHMGRVTAYEFEDMVDEITTSRRLARHIAVSCHECATGFLFLFFFTLCLLVWMGTAFLIIVVIPRCTVSGIGSGHSHSCYCWNIV